MSERLLNRLKTYHWFLVALLFIGALLFSAKVKAAEVKLIKVKPRATFVEKTNGVFEPLDLKRKIVKFTPKDFARCDQNLQRVVGTLKFSCRVRLPNKARKTKLHKQISSGRVDTRFGRAKIKVDIRVSDDARYTVFTAKFDDTGVDYEVSRFNDEFFGVYSKAASDIFKEAMERRLVLSVLEGNS